MSTAFPNVESPSVAITTRLPGAAPEQVETEVTDKIEEAVNTISGIEVLTSNSSEGVKKNSILQIDHANQLREAGLSTQQIRRKLPAANPVTPA